MPLDLRKVAVVMNAYPWTRGQLTNGDTAAPAHCAVGALLRDAGIPPERMPGIEVAYGQMYAILERQYGISGPETVHEIMAANDSARSRSEAIRRVLCTLSGVVDSGRVAREFGRSEHGSRLPPAA
jgi:hypothetical protein